MTKKLKLSTTLDWSLVILPILLSVASVATLYSITSLSGNHSLVYNQLVYIGLGALLYTVFVLFDYKVTKQYATYFFFAGILLLVLTDLLGQTVFGSRRWIDLGFTQFQPSELMKLLFLIFSAAYFSKFEKTTVRRLVFFLFLSIIPIFLILAEPDLGTSLVMSAIIISVILVSRVPKKVLAVLFVAMVMMLPVVWTQLKPYQKDRLTTFIHPENDRLHSGYNVSQSKIAVGSGGLFGKGFSGATQSQLQFLPVAHIDFIFSGWAEATGFVGSIGLVLVYCLLVYRIFSIGYLAKDRFGLVYCIGLGGMIFFQVFVNIGMNIGIMPVTGIPLPLVSAGGTSFLVVSASLGFVQSIYMRRKSLRFD